MDYDRIQEDLSKMHEHTAAVHRLVSKTKALARNMAYTQERLARLQADMQEIVCEAR